MNTLTNLSNMHNAGDTNQPNYAKNLIILGLIGVAAKIFLVLLVKLIEFYFPLPDMGIGAPLSIRNVLLLVFDLPGHLLLFGVIIGLAYKYDCVVVNAKNLFICIFAGFAFQGILLAGFSGKALEFAQNLGFGQYEMPIHLLRDTPLDMAAYTSPFYLLLLAMVCIAGPQIVFHCCSKANANVMKLPQHQSRFVMLLAFVCVLCGLFATAIEPSIIILLNFSNQNVVVENFLRWMLINHVVLKCLFLLFVWISYLIAARYFPKNVVTNKRDTISYALGVLILLAFLYIALAFVSIILFSALKQHSLSDSTFVILGTIIGGFFLAWMYRRMRSIMFCLLLFGFSLLHWAALLLMLSDFTFNLNSLKIIFSTGFFTGFFLNVILPFAAIEIPGWIIYSLAIQGSIKLMIAPDTPIENLNPVSKLQTDNKKMERNDSNISTYNE